MLKRNIVVVVPNEHPLFYITRFERSQVVCLVMMKVTALLPSKQRESGALEIGQRANMECACS